MICTEAAFALARCERRARGNLLVGGTRDGKGLFLVWAFGARDGLVESACVLYNGLRIYWP